MHLARKTMTVFFAVWQIYNEVVGREYDVIKPTIQLHAQQPCTNPFHQHDYDW